ncbi:MAG TPA: DUF4384 domain-containing protein [Rhodospirillaceae bacterium]|nr:DUF4384 domain-containing protein [Rhodospirillaceae bacterium]
MKPAALVFSLLLVLPVTAAADWVRATGSYIFPPEIPEAEACQNAENRARAEAIRQVSGESFAAEDTLRCAEQGDDADCARNSMIWTMVGGEIRGLRDRSQETRVEQESFRRCVVSFEADVHMARGRPDPDFTLGVALNNAVYREGEKLTVTLTPSQPMSVQLFQWLPYEKGDAQVSRLFPNRFDATARIEHPVTIPTETGARRYDLKLAFPANQPAGRKMVDEYLMVVATRTPVKFRDGYSLAEFNAVVAEIPQADRRIVRRAYNILRSGE